MIDIGIFFYELLGFNKDDLLVYVEAFKTYDEALNKKEELSGSYKTIKLMRGVRC